MENKGVIITNLVLAATILFGCVARIIVHFMPREG